MVNPGVFQGSRKEFLLGEKQAYAAGVDGGYHKDALAQIQRRYFKRYPLDLPHKEEPTAKHLAEVDDDEAEPETAVPDEENLDPEEYQTAMKELGDRTALLKQRKGQIARWLAYQYMKDHEADPKDTGAKNPYNILLHQLTGVSKLRPRLQPANKLWRRTQRDRIEAEVLKRAQAAGTHKKKLAPIREKVVKELFDALDGEEREGWSKMAKDEHNEAMTKFQEELKKPPASDPESRQRCIQSLTAFMKPILDIVCKATGWKVTLIAGGPEPAHEGRLNMISIHSVTTSGDVKMNFGRCEQQGFKHHLVPMFSRFLRKCYSPSECRVRALDVDHDCDRIVHMELDDAEVHSIELLDKQGSEPLEVQVSLPIASATTPSTCASSNPALHLTPTPSPPGSSAESPPRISPPRSLPPSPIGSIAPSPMHRASPPCSLSPSPIRSIALSPVQIDGENSFTTAAAQDDPQAISRISMTSTPTSIAQPTPISPFSIPPASRKRKTREEDDLGADEGVRNTKRREGSAPGASQAKGTRSRTNTTPSVSSRSLRNKTLKKTAAKPTPASKSTSTSNTSARAITTKTEPEWFVNCMALFGSGDYGEEWRELLETWAAFEQYHGYKEDGRFGTKHRPQIVSDWIKNGRPIPWDPTVANVKAFGDKFVSWWTEGQPKWRLGQDKKLDFTMTQGDWGILRLPGLNGLLTLIAGLFAWGRILETPSSSALWLSVVEDSCLALNMMLSEVE